MDDMLARHLARRAFDISRALQDVLVLLKDHLDEDEYRLYARAIAGSVQTVNDALLEKPLAGRPAIRAEIEASIDRYGRYL